MTPWYLAPYSSPPVCPITSPPHRDLANEVEDSASSKSQQSNSRLRLVGEEQGDIGWTDNHCDCIHNPFLAGNFSAEGPRLFFLNETPFQPGWSENIVRALPRVCKALEKYILLGSCLCKPFEPLKICKSAPFWWPNIISFCKIPHEPPGIKDPLTGPSS